MNFMPYCYRLHAANETIITIFMGILWYERRLRMLPDGEWANLLVISGYKSGSTELYYKCS